MSILSRVARLLGWEPVGATVNVKIDESSIPTLAGKKIIATVAAVEKNGAFVLKLATPLMQGEKTVREVIAYPRHTGYDIYHVAFGGIAVNLALCPGDELEQWFALALVKRHKA